MCMCYNKLFLLLNYRIQQYLSVIVEKVRGKMIPYLGNKAQ